MNICKILKEIIIENGNILLIKANKTRLLTSAKMIIINNLLSSKLKNLILSLGKIHEQEYIASCFPDVNIRIDNQRIALLVYS